MARHNELGEWGEKQAEDYLVTQGFSIYLRDSTMGRNEVDIIAFKCNRVHFVEVKTRSGADDPLEAVTPAKQRRISRFADSFIRSRDLPLIPQFDIIAIVGSPATGLKSLDHYPDAFYPPLSR